MFGSVVLDVAIGLSLLFLFVSLICSAIREAIETVVNSRASDLERGIRELLDDPKGLGPARAFYAHPLIFALYDGEYTPQRLRPYRSLLTGHCSLRMPIRARGSLPAYIPSPSFARAFLDLAIRGPIDNMPETRPAVPLSIMALQERAHAFPDGRLRRALLTALDDIPGGTGTGSEITVVRHNLEAWFESCMDRVSGWYKRRTQVLLFLIGLVCAALMNIDAFSVARALLQDKALRDGAVEQAATIVQRAVVQSPLPDAARQSFTVLQDDLDAIQFPTGWQPPPQRRVVRLAGGAGLDLPAILQMLIGWIITAFAVTLGAPFWFDMLGRFVTIRSTMKPLRSRSRQA